MDSKEYYSHLKIGITDLDGILRGKFIHTNKFEQAKKKGLGFCNVLFGWDIQDECYEGLDVSGWHNGYRDYFMTLDLESKRILEHENNVPFYFGDYYGHDGKVADICPRSILKKILKKANKAGLIPIYGTDLEWFNFERNDLKGIDPNKLENQTLTKGMFGYSLIRLFENKDFFNDLLSVSSKAGIPIEGFHTETGPGVVEAAIMKSFALRTADNVSLLKTIVKNLASKHGILSSFMAKWNNSLPGCSMHFHHSFDSQSSRKFGYGKDYKLNAFSEHFIAGQLKLLPYLMPFYAPSINSYKRYIPGSWAPTKICWGTENRTSAIRVIPESETSFRLENRIAGADANPYLAIGASLASGLWGVENKVKLDLNECITSAYEDNSLEKLSSNLLEATKLMDNSKEVRSIFGDTFIDHFSKTRYSEWEKYERSVTDWELKRYFEII